MNDATMVSYSNMIMRFGVKMETHTLTEYEMLLYEQLCKTMQAWTKYQETCLNRDVDNDKGGDKEGVS